MTQSLFVNPVQMPYFSPVFIPSLPSLSLSESERAIISKLQMRGWRNRYWMELTDSYYRGMQVIQDLGIAIPPELSGQLRTIVGWPRIGVDPYVERLAVDCFRLAGETKGDQDLEDLWLANGMDAEQSLAYTDALVMRHSWLLLGSPEDDGDPAQMCVESPLNISASWDVRSAQPKEILQSYWLDDRRHAALYLPDQTVHIGEDDDGVWQITDRDVHNFGFCPGVRMAHMPRSDNRDGVSAITPELMSITDAACRTLLGLTVASELYSVPQKYLLGAAESAFEDQDGNPVTVWQTYISSILGLERDEAGEVPKVGQFKSYDPSVYTTVIEMYASQAAGILGAPPQDLGLYTTGNPVSAEAAQVSEGRRDRRATRMGAMFGVPWRNAMQMALRFMNKGELPKKYERIAVDWADPRIPNFTGTADGLQKLESSGIIPARSDVTRKRAGFNAVERAQLRKDDADPRNQAQEFVQEAGTEVEDKAIRAVSSLAKEAATPVAPVTP